MIVKTNEYKVDNMEIKTAQHDVQTTFLRGAVGQTVSGLIWLASAWIVLALVLTGWRSEHTLNSSRC